MVDQNFHSLDDFLISNSLSVNGYGEDGFGIRFPVKGREIEGTVLFADITNFSGSTEALSSTETLAFVNHFFTWIAEEALRETHGIVDKYIGDEIMIVFSPDFGSPDSFAEAMAVARQIGECDPFGFSPHIGIASGPMTVGYVGSRVKYNCSVFGRAVALASRCARERTPDADVSIVSPAAEWNGRAFDDLFPLVELRGPDGVSRKSPRRWELQSPKTIMPKNMSPIEIQSINRTTFWLSEIDPTSWAKETIDELKRRGDYCPRTKP